MDFFSIVIKSIKFGLRMASVMFIAALVFIRDFYEWFATGIIDIAAQLASVAWPSMSASASGIGDVLSVANAIAPLQEALVLVVALLHVWVVFIIVKWTLKLIPTMG